MLDADGQYYYGPAICPKCNLTVFHAEWIVFNGEAYHQSCFICADCRRNLNSANARRFEGKLLCNACFTKGYGMKGYGYGGAVICDRATIGASSQDQPLTAQAHCYPQLQQGGASGWDPIGDPAGYTEGYDYQQQQQQPQFGGGRALRGGASGISVGPAASRQFGGAGAAGQQQQLPPPTRQFGQLHQQQQPQGGPQQQQRFGPPQQMPGPGGVVNASPSQQYSAIRQQPPQAPGQQRPPGRNGGAFAGDQYDRYQ